MLNISLLFLWITNVIHFFISSMSISMAKIDKGSFPADFADAADFIADKNSFLRLSAKSAGATILSVTEPFYSTLL
ncbi:MAG: hypothetical protein WKG06_18960 [Segetibacter sp.]